MTLTTDIGDEITLEHLPPTTGVSRRNQGGCVNDWTRSVTFHRIPSPFRKLWTLRNVM